VLLASLDLANVADTLVGERHAVPDRTNLRAQVFGDDTRVPSWPCRNGP